MNKFRSQFIFNKEQRTGIFFLVLLNIGLLGVFHFIDFSEDSSFDITSNKIISIQQELDSLRNMELESKRVKLFPFNPNYIDDFKGYALGMSLEEIDRLKNYRTNGKWINSTKDFQRVTGVSDSLLNQISQLFKFPDWVSKPRNNYLKTANKFEGNTKRSDLNIATEFQLQKISGIGKTLSKRIIKYRDELGGFTSDTQVYHVFGLDEPVVENLLKEFTVKTPKEIIKINLNIATASDLSTIPGISFDLGKKIWEFRILNEQVESFSELIKIEGMTERKIEVIQLYLSLD